MRFFAPFVAVLKLKLLDADLQLFHILEERETKFDKGLSNVNIFGFRCDL